MKGSVAMTEKMRKALREAVIGAIEEVGIEQFKKTSLFLSNDRARTSEKLAA